MGLALEEKACLEEKDVPLAHSRLNQNRPQFYAGF